jgi:hypothetical protein
MNIPLVTENYVASEIACRRFKYDRMTVNNESGEMLDEVVVAYFKALFRNLPRETVKTHESPQSGHITYCVM